jgi:phospholipid/cholesterol/gamma-HCH transport system permease protein
MNNYVAVLGERFLCYLQRVGQAGILLFRLLLKTPKLCLELPLLVEQLYSSGVLSLVIILTSSVFIGMVLALQGYHTLSSFGALQQLGPLVALSVARELGPVVTAILFAGRAGAAITAEIALMQATEQLASMEMLAVDPLSRVIAPRFWGGMLAVPLLTIIFDSAAIFGAFIVGVKWLGLDGGIFWANMQAAVDFKTDIANGIIKSVVFGAIVSWIAVCQGYYGEPTASGVATSTTRTVVYSAVLVLALDFVLTMIMLQGW